MKYLKMSGEKMVTELLKNTEKQIIELENSVHDMKEKLEFKHKRELQKTFGSSKMF